MIKWKIEPKKTALLIIDMQNGFIEEGAPFEVSDGRRFVPRLVQFRDVCRSKGIPVIYIVYLHRPSGVDMGLSRLLWDKVREGKVHRKGTHNAEIYDELKPKEEDIIVEKHRHSAFYGTDLEIILRNMAVDVVLITGVTTNVCCGSTAIDAMARDFRVVFLRDLTATFDIPNIDGGMIPKDEVQRFFCSLVAFSLGEVTNSSDIIARITG